MRVPKHRNGLPRETVNAPVLEAFKAKLDGGLSNLVLVVGVPAHRWVVGGSRTWN